MTDSAEHIDVRAMRTELGMTQEEFADFTGVKQATVSRWETKGVPAVGLARRVLERVKAGEIRRN